MSHYTMNTALKARNIVTDMEPRLAGMSLEGMRRFVVQNATKDSAITKAVVDFSLAAAVHCQDEFPGEPVGLDLDLQIAFTGHNG